VIPPNILNLPLTTPQRLILLYVKNILSFFVVLFIRSVEDEISHLFVVKTLLKVLKRKGLMIAYVRW